METTKTVKAKPAKKPPANPQKKLLLTAAKKTINTNTVLPILEDILFTPGLATVSDLETVVQVPYDMKGVPKKGIAVPGKMFYDIMDIVESPSIKVDKDLGCQFIEDNRTMKVQGEDSDNFPRTPLDGEDLKKIGTLTEADMATLKTAVCFTSNDDLRPAMTGVFFSQQKMVATDAHRLFFKDYTAPMTREFILPRKAALILLALGGEWELQAPEDYERDKAGELILRRPLIKVEQKVTTFEIEGTLFKGGTLEDAEAAWAHEKKSYGDTHETLRDFLLDKYRIKGRQFKVCDDPDEIEEIEIDDMSVEPAPQLLSITYVCFARNDGARVIARTIDARFPDYKVVIPEGDGLVHLESTKEFLLKELKNAGKFANRSTSQVTVGMNGKLSFASQDVDFNFEYTSDYENGAEGKFSFLEGFKMPQLFNGIPVKIKKDLGSIVTIEDPEDSWKTIDIMKSDLTTPDPALYIAFNSKFLTEILHHIPDGEPVKMKMWAPTKCAIINETFLLMPLMLNQ